MATKSGSMVGTNVTDARSELLTQVAGLFRGIPHRKGCSRKPPIDQNIRCSCDVGDKLAEIHKGLVGIIVEVTDQ